MVVQFLITVMNHHHARCEKAPLIYEYDFGDGWEHDVVVEKIVPADPERQRAVYLAGKNPVRPKTAVAFGVTTNCFGHPAASLMAGPNFLFKRRKA